MEAARAEFDFAAARLALDDIAHVTPVLSSRSVSAACSGNVLLKAECLQRTGSFKLRGALAKLARLGDATIGVATGSAGNHAQALAYAAQARGVACTVYMPRDAPLSKVAAVDAFGAKVELVDGPVDRSIGVAREYAESTGAAFVHPFDDPDVIAGQGTVGLELFEQVPDLAKIIVPVGGGGLISGVAMAVKAKRPDVEVVGVQASACAAVARALQSGGMVELDAVATVADGIAVKRPGELTLPLIERWADGIFEVGDDDIAEAIVLMLERAKLVVEGAGATGVAALVTGAIEPAPNGATVVVLSGGNIDAGLLATVTRRHETERGRRLRIFTRVADRPGALATLLAMLADGGANLIDIEHIRDAVSLHVRETGVELTLETRNADHAERLLGDLRGAGYAVERLT
jgi:threonine dehydratase